MSFYARIKSKTFVLIVLIIALTGLTSCLDIETEMKISRKGMVKAVITYTLHGNIADFGRGFGADEPWPLPLTETEFRRRSVEFPETKLISYKAKYGKDDGDVITVELKSESVQTLAYYLDMEMGLSENTFYLNIPDSGDYRERSEETRVLIDSLVGDSIVSFRLKPPRRPIETESGILDGRAAVLSFSMNDVLYGRTPARWTVSW